MPERRSQLSHVRTEGGILPIDILNRILKLDRELPGLRPEDYGLAPSEKINEAINRSWQRMVSLWNRFSLTRKDIGEGETGTTQTRQHFLLPLFDELGYGRLQPATARQRSVKDLDRNDVSYAISHMWNASPIHLIGCNMRLDVRQRGAIGAAQASPHSLVQEFLNRSDSHLWGFVSNGLVLRILRDCASLSRQAYIEFDLEAIFADSSFSDFALLWLLCHQSRVETRPVEEGQEPSPEGCLLETWTQEARESALEALDNLRNNVETAIAILGQGFLEAGNAALQERLHAGALPLQDYFHQLLRLVYRLIFCFVAEDRGLIHAPGTPEDVRNRYQKYYSMQRLRNLARRMSGTGHADLYEGLKLTMRMFGSKEGCAGLGISPMGGFLWSPGAVPDLMDARLSNDCLLEAVRALAFISAPGISGSSRMRPVDYRHLGARELGSVYESLLELHPELSGKGFTICDAAGNERKKTGAYYTPAQLITSLLETALDPVIARACRSENPEDELLRLKILDPACGSGHFLLDAARRVAERLAAQRSGDADPSPAAVQEALRDVVSRCIYGVDINPMSVELCKLSLWMEAMEAGKPLSFLDHHIVCANSLLGTTPELVRKGLPDEAFAALDGDDKAAVSALKKRNRAELSLLRQEDNLFAEEYGAAVQAIHALASAKDFDAMPSDTLEQVEAKEDAFKKYKSSDEYRKKKKLCDMWCAAFVAPKLSDGSPENTAGITQNEIRRFCTGKELPEELDALIEKAAEDYQFLHWHIAFPEVMAKGGFDVVLGNPPWEKIKIQEKEWFAARVPAIANALNAAERKRMIAGLQKSDPALYQAFKDVLRVSAGASHFIRNSGRYPLCGCGDINMYAVFAENMRNAVNERGRVGCIVPSGIATDDTTKRFFQNMVEKKSLISLFDFENKGIFPGVHSSYKFSLLTAGNSKVPLADEAEFVFFAHSTEDLKDPQKRFSLSPADIAQMNPNTQTCPIFRSRKDAELTKAAYRRVPVLRQEEKKDAEGKMLRPERNPWSIRFGTLFHMSNDSSLFRTYGHLAEAGGVLRGNRFFVEKDVCLQTDTGPLEVSAGTWLPLYEAKMVHHYNHRWATFDGEDVRNVELDELTNPEYVVQPRYWVHENQVQSQLDTMGWKHDWLMGWRKICRATDERTVVGGIFPSFAVGDSLPLWLSANADATYLPSIVSSFVSDYFARFKIGGINFNFFIAQQLAVLPPETFSRSLPWLGTPTIADFIRPRVLELTYTAWDMKPFAEELGYDGEPFIWDEERRFTLRCELDALFFHLYLPSNPDGSWKQAEGETTEELASLKEAFPTPRSAVDYIMETFPIRKKKDTAAFGSYRTKDEILRVYDAMQEAAMAK